MKYLKLFESFNISEGYLNSGYYEEITDEEIIHCYYEDRIDMGKWVKKLEKLGFKKISNDIGNSLAGTPMEKRFHKSKVRNFIMNVMSLGLYSSSDEVLVTVYLLEDEYFLVREVLTESMKITYYRCDQWSGLLKLLTDKGWVK